MNDNPIPTGINIAELIKHGEDVYQQNLKGTLEQTSVGQYVAIEPETRSHFVGETRDEAIGKARKEFPTKVFYVRRIGELEKIAKYAEGVLERNYSYDWLF